MVDHHIARELLWQPLKAIRIRVVLAGLALLFLACAQGLLVFLLQAVLRMFFGPQTLGESVALSELLPSNLRSIGVLQSQVADLSNVTLSATDLLTYMPCAIVVVGLASAGASFIFTLQQQAIAIELAANYRDRFFARLLQRPYESIRRRAASAWMSMVMNDVVFLQQRFTDIATAYFRGGTSVMAGIVAMFLIFPPLGFLLLLLAPAVAWSMGRAGRRIAWFADHVQRELGRIASVALDIRQRFDFIRAQGGEALEQKRFDQLAQSYFNTIRRSILMRSAFAPAAEFVGFALLGLAALAVVNGFFGPDFSGDVLVQFFAALGIALKPLRDIGEQTSKLHETRGALRGSLEVFKSLPESAWSASLSNRRRSESKPEISADAFVDGVRIKRMGAGYDGQELVQIVDVDLNKGLAIAIAGPSGAGKSTLIKTFAGLMEPLDWQVNVSWRDLSAQASLVGQEPFLFHGTLLENLLYGRDLNNPNYDEIWDALDLVNMTEEINAMPLELQTVLSGESRGLSGGQIQRLSIARALLRRRRFWLFDEATSAVDAASEQDIITRIVPAARAKGAVLLYVTHRLDWLSRFDEVWFMEDGRITARGPHRSLLEIQRYRAFCNGAGVDDSGGALR